MCANKRITRTYNLPLYVRRTGTEEMLVSPVSGGQARGRPAPEPTHKRGSVSVQCAWGGGLSRPDSPLSLLSLYAPG